jgi:ATP-dependent Clp protease ATP-binding subunit ClpA
MTSNLGARENENNSIGFGALQKTGEEDKALKDYFKPELRNRLDLVCKFNALDKFAIKKVICKFVEELHNQLKVKKISLTLSENLIEHLAEVGYDPAMGARPLGRKIDELIKVPLSKRILFEELQNCEIVADYCEDSVQFDVKQKDQDNDNTTVIQSES